MRRAILLISTCFLAGCSHYFYYVKFNDNSFFDKCSSITLDSTYEFYVRKVVKVENADGKNLKMIHELHPSDKNPLIEVEYLLLSRLHKNVVYISTLPDKFQEYYQKKYFGDGYINVWDFKTILFGKMSTDSLLEFISKDGKYYVTWQLVFDRKDIVLDNIQESDRNDFQLLIPANKALEDPILFKHIGNFQLVYHDPGDSITKNIIPVVNSRIRVERNGRKYTIYFQFASELKNKYSIIYFSNKRIPYAPDKLF